VIAVALIIERAVTLRSSKINPPTLLEQVLTVYQRQGITDEVLERSPRIRRWVRCWPRACATTAARATS
jgi:hypothetical protein